jgi:hypothetical protein
MCSSFTSNMSSCNSTVAFPQDILPFLVQDTSPKEVVESQFVEFSDSQSIVCCANHHMSILGFGVSFWEGSCTEEDSNVFKILRASLNPEQFHVWELVIHFSTNFP